MASSGRVARTHPSQWATIVDFIERHPEMVTHKFVGMHGRENFNKLWEELSVVLNSMGFGMKESKKWQELFGKWKSKVKIKAQEIICKAQKTGAGGPEDFLLSQLSPAEERLMALIGWKIVTGDENKEMGVENVFDDENVEKTPEENTEERPSSSARRSLMPLFVKNSSTLISPLPGTSKSCSNSLPELLAIPPLVSNKRKSLESAPISFKNKDKQIVESIQSPETTVTKKGKPTPSKKPTGEAKHLLDMHKENMDMLKEINSNLARLADSQESQTKVLSEFLDVLKTKF